MELQFLVDTSAVNTIKGLTIGANFDELSLALSKLNDDYKNILYTEEEIPLAKKELAKLRNLQKHINEYKIFVTKQAGEPIERFKDQCKKVISILDDATNNLNRQITESDERRKEEKLFLLHDYFDNAQKNMKYPEYITWEFVENPKWGNVTYAVETAHKDIDNACMSVDRDVQQIIDLSSEFQLTLLDEYKRGADIFSVFQMQERLAAQKLREEQRQAELEAQYREERAKKVADQIKNQSNQKVEKEEPEQLFLATYEVCGTYEELMSLQNLLSTLKVKYSLLGTKKVTE